MKKFTWLGALLALLAVMGLGIACDTGSKNGGDEEDGKRYTITNRFDESGRTKNNGYLSISPVADDYAVGTPITITSYPEPDYKINWVRSDSENLKRSGGVYRFNMPAKNITITANFIPRGNIEESAKVFMGAWSNNGELDQQTNWGDETEAAAQLAAFGAGAAVSSTGGAANGRTIKLDVTKVSDFYVLGLKFDGFDLGEESFNELCLDARTTYTGTGLDAQTPAFDQIIFGEDGGEWWEIKNAVHYMGELGPAYLRQSPLVITEEWKSFSVPIPVRQGKINLVQLFFTPKQIEGVVIFLDNIYFSESEDDAVLKRVELPTSAASIPWKNAAGQTLETDLSVLTMETNLIYEYGGEEFSFFGENPDYNQNAFLNKFIDWYGVSNIRYTLEGDLGTPANGKLTPTGYEKTGTLNVTYTNPLKSTESCSSTTGMVVSSLKQTTPFTAGMRIDGFDTIGSTMGNVDNWTNLPFFHGGDAGDAQWYGNGMMFFIDDITKEGNFRPNGTLYDSWYQMGYQGLNHNLNAANEIVVNMSIRRGIVYHFTLVSGWSAVPSTLAPADAEGVRKQGSSYAVITGTSDAAVDYVLRKNQDFTGDVDWNNVTSYYFITDKEYNTSAQAKASWSAASGGHHVLMSITVR